MAQKGFTAELSLKIIVLGITSLSVFTDLMLEQFLLTGQFDPSNSSGLLCVFIDGSFVAGDLLPGQLDSPSVIDFGNGSSQFEHDLQFTGGSLFGYISSGGIESVPDNLVGDLADDFSADTVAVVAGAFVPIASAVQLLGSALIGFVGLRREAER